MTQDYNDVLNEMKEEIACKINKYMDELSNRHFFIESETVGPIKLLGLLYPNKHRDITAEWNPENNY